MCERSKLSVEELTKKWLETRDDSLLDVLKAGDEDCIDRAFPPWPASILERYKVGAVCLHIHGRCRVDSSQGYCIRLSSVNGLASHQAVDLPIAGLNKELCIAAIGGRENNGSVLIRLTEFVHNREGIGVCVPIASEARLELLNQCLGVNRHPSKPPARESISGLLGLTNRELGDIAPAQTILSPRQPADQVVKRGSHVEQTVPNNSAEMDERIRITDPMNDPCLGCISIVLDHNDPLQF